VTDLRFRRATRADLPAIVEMLADDFLGAAREAAGDPGYEEAFAEIDADPQQLLIVGERGDALVAFMQLTWIRGLAQRGARRAIVESVRVASAERRGGVGAALIGYAIEAARARGCDILQLTTDKRRADAQRFYARLGFVASHEGMKLKLAARGPA
jgi:GNAT superfamily N-acetyltransferase